MGLNFEKEKVQISQISEDSQMKQEQPSQSMIDLRSFLETDL